MLRITRIVITMIFTRVTAGSSILRGQLRKIERRNVVILRAHCYRCQRRCRIGVEELYGFPARQVRANFWATISNFIRNDVILQPEGRMSYVIWRGLPTPCPPLSHTPFSLANSLPYLSTPRDNLPASVQFHNWAGAGSQCSHQHYQFELPGQGEG